MILIADSGSTKTHWCVCNEDKAIKEVFTKGINPYYQTSSEIKDALSTFLIPEIDTQEIETIYFYGAGCATPEKISEIKQIFNELIPQAETEVSSDLLGACRSLLGEQAGVACILGTGSNSCLYDGKEIISHVSPLGFILGDEGSGAHMGKMLVSDILKDQLPQHIKKQFFEEFHIDAAQILENVYREPFPNRYLAHLSQFLAIHIQEPECYDLVHESFRLFFERNILQYDITDESSINFIGSIAFFYEDILERVATEFGLWVEKIEKTPMSGLINYHLSNHKNQLYDF